jgi:hypothetical protein
VNGHPNVQLSELRLIAWRYWDPIGLSDGSKFGPARCADEYDRYLMNVVSQLTHGARRPDAASYLCEIASNQMGLSNVDADAAKKTVDAIADYLAGLAEVPHVAN